MLIVMLVFVTFSSSPVSKLYQIPVLGKLGLAVIVADALKFPSITMLRSACESAIRRPVFQSDCVTLMLYVPCVKAVGYNFFSDIIFAHASAAALRCARFKYPHADDFSLVRPPFELIE